jgi:glucans biosynthesis protein C
LAIQSWPSRRYDLDWIRVLAVASVVIYHFATTYTDYYPTSPPSAVHSTLSGFVAATHPWRMALLFLVSGVVSRHLYHKAARASGFLKTRLLRLLPPFFVGTTLLVPLQHYLILRRSSPGISFWSVWLDYAGLDDWLLVTGRVDLDHSIGHLWYIHYLIMYVIGITALSCCLPRFMATISAAIARNIPLTVFLVVPTFLIAIRFLFLPLFPYATGAIGDIYRHIAFGTLFIFGFVGAPSDAFWHRVVNWRWLGIGVALASFSLIRVFTATTGGNGAALAEQAQPLLIAIKPIFVWSTIVAILGFAAKHATNTIVLARLGPSAMVVYLLHPVVIELMYDWLPPQYDLMDAGLVLLLVYAACLGAHEIIRRNRVLSFCFGLAPSEVRSRESLSRTTIDATEERPSAGAGSPRSSREPLAVPEARQTLIAG